MPVLTHARNAGQTTPVAGALRTRSIAGRPVNAMTIDLEDWPQSVLSPDLPITDAVLRNTDRLLDLLARRGVRATFFALGKVCERHPGLLPAIAAAGHEVATHGYGHELVYRMSPGVFRDDVRRSIDIIGAQIGRLPIGYRAPGFSITARSRWAGPILAELGIRYSSSIFPIRGSRYGIADAPRYPHRWPTCPLIEFPLTTVRGLGHNLPVAGGGYLRLLPGPLIARAIASINRGGHPAVVYMHPYELAVNEVAGFRRQGWPVSAGMHFMQSLFRGRVRARLIELWRRFAFAPLSEVLQLESGPTACAGLRADHHKRRPRLRNSR